MRVIALCRRRPSLHHFFELVAGGHARAQLAGRAAAVSAGLQARQRHGAEVIRSRGELADLIGRLKAGI
jgi:hypothetical protein